MRQKTVKSHLKRRVINQKFKRISVTYLGMNAIPYFGGSLASYSWSYCKLQK